ncbi:MAG: ACT domain-containing protein [Gemmatimonadales bacterium]|nr:ACT domain-containing protein [Gemmatimonadales bacterium]
MTGKIAVGGITRKDGLVLVRILGARAGRSLAGQALSSLGLQGINVTCVTSFIDGEGLNNICFAIGENDLDQTLGILKSMEEEIQAGSIAYQRGCSAISIYGPHFSERPAIAGTVFEATAEAGVEIHMITTSFSTVSFLTNEDQAVLAVHRLNQDFLVP